MRYIKKFGILFLFLLMVLSNISLTLAATDYVGVNEDEMYTWKVLLDEKAIEDIIDDGEEYFPQTSDDGFEDNDDFFSAATIGDGYYSGLECSDDDWYNISLNLNDELSIDIYTWYSSPNLIVELYNETQILMVYSDNSAFIYREEIEFDANYTGNVYLRVYNETPGTMLYEMGIDIDEPPPPPPPPFDYRGYLEEFLEDYYDYEGISVEIEEIGREKEYDKGDLEEDAGGDITYDIEDFKGVKVEIEFRKTKDFSDENRWKKKSLLDEIIVVDPDERDYYHFILGGLALIIGEGVDWEEVIEDLEEDFEEEEDDIEEFFDDDDIEIEASVEWDGIRLKIMNEDNDISDFEVIARYHSNGVLEYFEIKYGDVQIALIELQDVIPDYLVTVGSIAAIIGGAAIVAIVIIYKKYFAGRKVPAQL